MHWTSANGATRNFKRRTIRAPLAISSIAAVIALTLAGNAATAEPETVLHSFTGSTHRDGNAPWGGLVADSTGALYGTTEYGGGTGGSGSGTVFQLTPPVSGNKWTNTILYDFQGAADGNAPMSGLVLTKNGVLYGTTEAGGAGGRGTIFSLTPPARVGGRWKHKVLYSFCSQANCPDGDTPVAGLVSDSSGAFYGTTQFGGVSPLVGNTGGVAFKLTPPAEKGGAWTETVLYNFCSQANCADGWQPYSGTLLLTQGGTIYGTTSKGGNGDDAGVVFSLVPLQGGGYAENVLHEFGDSFGDDGRGPYAGLVADKSGALYGTTVGGGTTSCGTVYSLNPAGGTNAYQVLYTFCAQQDHSDGALPYAGLIVESGRTGAVKALYGTTTNGNVNSDGGTVFKLAPSTGGLPPWNETVLYSFCGRTNCTDGSGPEFGSLLSLNGKLFGTTVGGGKDSDGAVFEVKE